MSNERNGIGTVVLSALVGGLAGAVVGLMVAPKSGQALRAQLGKKARTVLREVEGLAGERAVDAIHTVRADMVQEGKRLVRDIGTLVQELRKPEKGEERSGMAPGPAEPSTSTSQGELP